MENSSNVNNDQINKWLEKNVIQKVAEKLEKPSVNMTWKLSVPENSFFLSNVVFVELNFNIVNKLNVKTNNNDIVHLVIKRPGTLMSNELMHSAALFHNEILFYRQVSRNSEEFPRCLYYHEDLINLDNTVIVTDNIAVKGFDLCSKSYDIPFEYVLAGMQNIGRFHAMGYTMKIRDTREFSKICDDIQESRFIPGDLFNQFLNVIALRPIEWLRKQNYDSIFVNKMEKHLANAFDNIMMDAIKPVEPLAVLCHGDFTRNNIFFKRSDNNLDSMLIDFAMLRYSSPSTDLSTFLYLSCSNKDRRERFNEIFKAYHDALISYLREQEINNLDKYSYDKMLTDYKRKAMFGYITAIFFIPTLRGLVVVNEQDFNDFNPQKMGQATKAAGGDTLSKEFADMLLELRDSGCLDHVLTVQ